MACNSKGARAIGDLFVSILEALGAIRKDRRLSSFDSLSSGGIAARQAGLITVSKLEWCGSDQHLSCHLPQSQQSTLRCQRLESLASYRKQGTGCDKSAFETEGGSHHFDRPRYPSKPASIEDRAVTSSMNWIPTEYLSWALSRRQRRTIPSAVMYPCLAGKCRCTRAPA